MSRFTKPCNANKTNQSHFVVLIRKVIKKYIRSITRIQKINQRAFAPYLKKKRDITYLDKGFDKVLVNSVGIKTTYLKCRLFFSSKSKLYKYGKAGYIEKALSLSSAQLSLSLLIVILKAIYLFLGLGLTFRDQTYAIALITLTYEHLPPNSNLDSRTYVITSCGVTFVN